jgi:hypothetical protein
MSEQPAAAAASASALSDDQRATIERNRLAALERRRAAVVAAAAAPAAAQPCEPGGDCAAGRAANGDAPSAALPQAGSAAAPELMQHENAAQAPSAAAVPPPARACSLQQFDWIAVVDFECTCDEPVNTEPREIIEFPCVLLNTRTLELGGEFQLYCRPTEHPRLSAFCTRLTGITQEQVDAGVPLAAALEAHTAFLRAHGLLAAAGEAPRFAVATWSEWDCKVMLESETRWRRIQPPDHFRRRVVLRAAHRGLA